MEIAKGVAHTDYLNLDLSYNSNKDWKIAINYFEKRISERFIEPINVLMEAEKNMNAADKKFGFTILAIDFMLVETLQSFIEGKIKTNGKSSEVFKRFLTERANFKDYFESIFNPGDFYNNFRCGILHQSQTFGDTKVWTIGELIRKSGKYIIVNRDLFHKKIIAEFDLYLKNLRLQDDKKLLNNFKLKMDFICGKE